MVEGRGLAEGNTASETRPGRRAGPGVPSALDRVRQVARKDKEARFTALLHHVDRRPPAGGVSGDPPEAPPPGVDGVTWEDYGQDLEENLRDLHARVHRGAYRAKPSRRVYIPKAGRAAAAARHRRVGGQDRPAGGGRGAERRSTRWTSSASPTGSGRGAARMMRWTRSRSGSQRKKVNWVLDADIRDFFSSLDHVVAGEVPRAPDRGPDGSCA